MPHRIGVCSWSLRPATPAELIDRVQATGLSAVQLDLTPLCTSETAPWDLDETRELLKAAHIRVVSGMMGTIGEDYSSLDSIRETGGIRPDEHWEANRASALRHAEMAETLGLSLVTFHAGFLPEEPGDPERAKLIERLREVVDLFAERGVTLAFETGQETAETLLGVLEELERPAAGVNFDPANMILYAMGDPIEALSRLAPHVRQVHIKDAVRTETPGTWGSEVPSGTGQVDWHRFFDVIRDRALAVDFLIEREAGEDRVNDIIAARELVEAQLGRIR